MKSISDEFLSIAVPFEDILARISSEHRGCNLCEYGVRNYFNQSQKYKHMPLYLQKISAYQADDLNTCDCTAGRSLKRWLDKKIESMRLDELQLKELGQNVAQRRYDKLFNSSGAPEKYQEFKFKDYYERCKDEEGKKEAIGAIRQHYGSGWANDKRGIMLWGESDRGKTGALVPLFTHYLSETHNGLWIQYNELIAQLRNWEDGQVEDRIKELQRVPLLFIDDLGDPFSKNGVTDYVRDVLFRVFDTRSPKLLTFITSNLSPAEMAALFHERTVKRIAGLCTMIQVSGEPLGELRVSGPQAK